MRKIWTSGLHIHQETNGESQRIRISIEHLSSEIPNIDGPHDIWIHSSDYEKLQEQNKIMREVLEFYAENRNWEQRESGSVKLCTIDPVDHYQYVDKWGDVFWIGGKRAREALAKVNNENN